MTANSESSRSLKIGTVKVHKVIDPCHVIVNSSSLKLSVNVSVVSYRLM